MQNDCYIVCGVMMQSWFDEFTSIDTARGRFVKSIVSNAIETYYSGRQASDSNRKLYITCDEIVAAIAVDERIVTGVREVTCLGVETVGRMTRGQLVIEWREADIDKSQLHTVRLVTSINQQMYERMLIESVSVD